MKNYVSSGDIVTLVAPAGGVKSGKIAKVGNLVGYPQTDAAEGEKFGLKTLGVYVETVAAAANVTAGQAVYLKADGTLTTADAGNTLIGDALYAVAPVSGSAEVHVRLRG